jgi:hypothetical protein
LSVAGELNAHRRILLDALSSHPDPTRYCVMLRRVCGAAATPF